jgi:hypothetical protein
MKREQL